MIAIARDKRDEVKALLAAGGRTQREIALITGKSEATVSRIAEESMTDELSLAVGPRKWCASCGAHVLTPCVACAALGRESVTKDKADWDRGQRPPASVGAIRVYNISELVEAARNR